MNKFPIIILIAMLTISVVSAFDFDDQVSYDAKTQTYTITNAFGLGDRIGTLTLTSPQNNKVGAGYQKVAEILISNGEGDLGKLIDGIDLYNILGGRSLEKFQRNVDLKISTPTRIPKYDIVCNDVADANKTNYEVCNRLEVGTEIVPMWEDYNNTIVKQRNITIGLFTNVEIGDKVEWIPVIYGHRLDKWAVWTQSLDGGIMAYYDFENTTSPQFSLPDKTGHGNNGALTNMDGDEWVPGILGNGLFFNGTPSYVDIGNFSSTKPADYSISVWVNVNMKNISTGQIYGIVQSGDSGGADKNSWGLSATNSTGNDIIYAFSSNGGAGDVVMLANNSLTHSWNETYFPPGGWEHIVVTANSSHYAYYYNGSLIRRLGRTLQNSGTAFNTSIAKSGQVLGNSYFNGTMDEIGIWNRSLTAEEVSILFSGGNPPSYVRPTVGLISPADSFTTINTTVEFSCNVTSTQNISNLTLLIDGSLNETNSTGTNNTIYNFTKVLSLDEHNWTCQSCDISNNCDQPTERTLTVGFIEGDSSFNSTMTETSYQTFETNVSVGSNITKTYLNYNGTFYSGTATNYSTDNYTLSKTMDLPASSGNATFNFTFTVAGSNLTTDSQNITVNNLQYDICGGSLTTAFLNITFKNETIGQENVTAEIGSTWYYWAGSGTTFESISHTNTTENSFYQFCSSPTDGGITANVSMTYDNSYSEQRSFVGEFNLTNSTTTQTLYLLPTLDGIFVTFQVINVAEQPLAGVYANVTSGGVLIDSGTTDDAGSVTFFLDPDTAYTFMFYLAGFDIFSTTLTPTQSSYTITLGSAVVLANDFTRGISYTTSPSISTLNNDTIYNFQFNLTSTYWDVDSFGFLLMNSSGYVLNSTSVATNGGSASVQFNTSNLSYLSMNYFWDIDGNISNGTTYWYIEDSTGTGFGLRTFFNRVSTYLSAGMFGLDNFGLAIIIFLVIFIFTGIMSFKFGLTSPAAVLTIMLGLTLFFDLGLGLIPSPPGVSAGIHFPSLFMLLVLIIVLIREGTR